jgi:hypothetical protein
VYVRDDTYAIWVALALITATLPINERAGVLRAKNFDIAEIAVIFCYPDHDLAIVARVPNPEVQPSMVLILRKTVEG